MARARLAGIALALAACSADSEPPNVVAARDACKHREHLEMDVGISDYEACLGARANLTRPADRQLCALAKSQMSSEGICILAE